MGYNPDKPMEDRITDIGPPHYEQFFPQVIKENYGKWLYHEITAARRSETCERDRCRVLYGQDRLRTPYQYITDL